MRANMLKLHLVEKYLSQKNALLYLQLNLLLRCFSKVCSEKFFRTNMAPES